MLPGVEEDKFVGREMSLEPVRENEGVCGEKERRGLYKAEL